MSGFALEPVSERRLIGNLPAVRGKHKGGRWSAVETLYLEVLSMIRSCLRTAPALAAAESGATSVMTAP